MTSHMTQQQLTIRSRQLNPKDPLFWKSRGYQERPLDWQDLLERMGYYDDDTEDEESEGSEYEDDCEEDEYSDDECDGNVYDDDEYDEDNEEDEEDYEEHKQKSNRNNPNNNEYWIARGYFNGRPENWRELIYRN
ncbi:hypothetical protein NQ318_009233 [Aromia moschata]|uniref:Uncharacterized protein n=1 Tax=Aromia moschata TaxID=1265417 RepID=A0AAV8YAF2_9CUCU|nr:hypothetical protein NQ318_009233 [Aromia moschata]